MIWALLELQFCDSQRRAELDCNRCPDRVQKLRRCREDKWNFTSDDASFWPMRVSKGGELYGFCPAKATWDQRVIDYYQALVVASECGSQWCAGGLKDQPSWWLELLSSFAPSYNELRFTSRARAILGDGSSTTKGAKDGARQRNTRS